MTTGRINQVTFLEEKQTPTPTGEARCRLQTQSSCKTDCEAFLKSSRRKTNTRVSARRGADNRGMFLVLLYFYWKPRHTNYVAEGKHKRFPGEVSGRTSLKLAVV